MSRRESMPVSASSATPLELQGDRVWINSLPPFCTAQTVAEIFDVSITQVRRWMGDENSVLPRAKRPDKKIVTSRAHVIALARDLYGQMDGNASGQSA